MGRIFPEWMKESRAAAVRPAAPACHGKARTGRVALLGLGLTTIWAAAILADAREHKRFAITSF
jgi:hypothetical protein